MHALLIGLLFSIAVTASGQSYLPSAFVPGRDYPSLKLKDGTVYERVRVLYLSEAEIRIRHENGSASVPLSALTPDELSRTGFSNPPTRVGAMSRIMSPSDRSRTGIDKLSSAEQERLQDWIIRAADSHLNDAMVNRHRAPITSASQPKRTAPKPHSKPPVRLTASAAPSPQALKPRFPKPYAPGRPGIHCPAAATTSSKNSAVRIPKSNSRITRFGKSPPWKATPCSYGNPPTISSFWTVRTLIIRWRC